MTKLTHFIKAWIFLSFMLYFVASAQPQSQNIIIVNNAVGFPDSAVLINLDIQNDEPYNDFIINIALPAGFSYIMNSVVINPQNPNIYYNSAILSDSSTLRIQGISFSQPIVDWLSISFTLNTPSQTGTYPLMLLDCLLGNQQGQNIITAVVNGTVSIIEVPAISPGDANCDGEVNVQDLVVIVSHILGNTPQPFCFENADVNGDGVINVTDVVATVNIILGG